MKTKSLSVLTVAAVLVAHTTVASAQPYLLTEAVEAQVQMQTQFNQIDEELDHLLAEESAQPETMHGTSKVQVTKMEKKLKRRFARSLKRMESKIRKWSDEKVAEQLSAVSAPSTESAEVNLILNSTRSDREKLVEITSFSFNRTIPAIAKEIVKAGGMIPYVFKAKQELKELKASYSTAKIAKQGRSIASYGLNSVLIALIVVVAVITGFIFSPALAIVPLLIGAVAVSAIGGERAI